MASGSYTTRRESSFSPCSSSAQSCEDLRCRSIPTYTITGPPSVEGRLGRGISPPRPERLGGPLLHDISPRSGTVPQLCALEQPAVAEAARGDDRAAEQEQRSGDDQRIEEDLSFAKEDAARVPHRPVEPPRGSGGSVLRLRRELERHPRELRTAHRRGTALRPIVEPRPHLGEPVALLRRDASGLDLRDLGLQPRDLALLLLDGLRDIDDVDLLRQDRA